MHACNIFEFLFENGQDIRSRLIPVILKHHIIIIVLIHFIHICFLSHGQLRGVE